METNVELFNNLKFKKNTSAIVFKFANEVDHETNTARIAIGYSEIGIKSAGKKIARVVYDGSIFESRFSNKLGETWDYYIADHLVWQPVNQDAWRLGAWLVIPKADITEEKPISFWIEEAKKDFIHSMKRQYTDELFNQFKTLIEESDVKEITVEEWNQKRKDIFFPASKAKFYTTK
ncbi:TPA: hypothetical protein ACPVZG_005321 [Vibrio parahaemolyticus]|uniref:Uncharacterized protein n=1 Tax=Vibrio parahaemolyticus TaxID=670 RepID=A0AAW8Q0K8_VIBPH|nr:hypothetical protein [Vibrio parahaemolyticus]MDS1821200.1 hypothetical protein [Vibrio parahaemolyticus]